MLPRYYCIHFVQILKYQYKKGVLFYYLLFCALIESSQCVELGGNCCTLYCCGANNDGLGGKPQIGWIGLLRWHFINQFINCFYLAWDYPANMVDFEDNLCDGCYAWNGSLQVQVWNDSTLKHKYSSLIVTCLPYCFTK